MYHRDLPGISPPGYCVIDVVMLWGFQQAETDLMQHLVRCVVAVDVERKMPERWAVLLVSLWH